jgi:hypothetical protein
MTDCVGQGAKYLKKYTNSFSFTKSMMTVFSGLRKIASKQLNLIRQYQRTVGVTRGSVTSINQKLKT